MATEQIGIEIEIKGSTKTLKSVKDLKDAVKELEKTASEADYGSDEYQKATKAAEDLKKKMGELSGDASKKLGNSLKDLSRQYKDLKVALSEAADPAEFAKLSQELNDVEGQIGDINDAANLATGSGVEQLQKGFSTIQEGFTNFDFGKVKMGLKAVGNAMMAIAPLLLIEGIRLLIENWDKVVEFGKQVTGTFSAQELALQSATKAYEKQKEATSALVNQYENEIKILEASGASDAKVLERKRLLIAAKIQELKASVAVIDATMNEIKANDDLSESLGSVSAWIQRKLGNEKAAEAFESLVQIEKLERVAEEQKKKTEALNAIASLEADLVVLEINNDNKIAESNKKLYEEKKRLKDEEAKLISDFTKEQNKLREEENKRILDEEKKLQEDLSKAQDIEIEKQIQAEQKKFEADKKKREQDVADYKKAEEEKAKAKLALERTSFDAAKGLSDAVFAIQLSNAKKGSAEETKLKKQQFQINKAFAITQATIDGIRAVQTVLASYPLPFSIPIAAATGIASAANIAKIAASKFDGGASGGGSVSAPSVGSGTTNLPTPPTINQSNTTTQFDNEGNNLGQSTQRIAQEPIKVFVTENDITEIQTRSNKLKAQTTF